MIGISPTFASGMTSYAASVANDVEQVTIEATANDSNAGVEYLDGSDAALTDADDTKAGFQVDLGVGENVVKAKVTAEDDATTETYQVTVTRAAPLPGRVLVSNLGQSDDGQDDIGEVNSSMLAVKFSTGSQGSGYDLAGVQIAVENVTGNSLALAVPVVTLREPASGNAASPSDTVLYTLTHTGTLTEGNVFFEAPANATLAKDSDYFIVMANASTYATGRYAVSASFPTPRTPPGTTRVCRIGTSRTRAAPGFRGWAGATR